MTSTANTYDPERHAASLGIRIVEAQPPAGTLALWDEQTPMDDVASTKRERRADTVAAGWLLQPHAVRTALAVAPDSLPAAAAELEVTERILSAWLWEHSKRGGLDS